MAQKDRFRLSFRKENDRYSGLGILDMGLDGRYFIAWNDSPSKEQRESMKELVRLANKAVRERV